MLTVTFLVTVEECSWKVVLRICFATVENTILSEIAFASAIQDSAFKVSPKYDAVYARCSLMLLPAAKYFFYFPQH